MSENPLSIVQLVTRVGSENIQLQALSQSFVGADQKGKNASITFATDPDKVKALILDQNKEICLILWMPRDLAEAAKSAKDNGAEMIAAERQRQITAEGWTPEHDDSHTQGEMARAACTYAMMAACQAEGLSADETHDIVLPRCRWPWDDEWWKPGEQIRNLEKAGALIASEIDRLQRRENAPAAGPVFDPGPPCPHCNHPGPAIWANGLWRCPECAHSMEEEVQP